MTTSQEIKQHFGQKGLNLVKTTFGYSNLRDLNKDKEITNNIRRMVFESAVESTNTTASTKVEFCSVSNHRSVLFALRMHDETINRSPNANPQNKRRKRIGAMNGLVDKTKAAETKAIRTVPHTTGARKARCEKRRAHIPNTKLAYCVIPMFSDIDEKAT